MQTRSAFGLAAIAATLATCALSASAQIRPADDRPLPGAYLESTQDPLPSISDLVPPDTGDTIVLDEIRFVGNTVFSDEQLARIARPFVGSNRAEDIVALLDAVTRAYLEAGYVTSGATLDSQGVADGTLVVRVVEGDLSEIEVSGLARFRRDWIRTRLAVVGPVRIQELEERIRRLQSDPRIERVDVRLQPDVERGHSVLRAHVVESAPWLLRSEFANDRSPSVGSRHARLTFGHLNLTGRGDVLTASLGATRGLGEWEAHYGLPLGGNGTRLEVYARRSAAELVESPLASADIESEVRDFSLGVRHPLFRSESRELWLGVRAERRTSELRLAGEGFSFAPGPEDGKVRLTVLRGFQEWRQRSQHQVLALRSTFSFGLDAWNTTDTEVRPPGIEVPEGSFVSWLGQVQYARRLGTGFRGTQLIARADVQLARDPLFGIERLGLGGSASVRGYRENEFVRDNGWIASIELRVPIVRSGLDRPVLSIAPFTDIGQAWNEGSTRGPRTLWSAGLGLRYEPTDRLSASVYWGGRLRSVDRRDGDNSLQDAGVHIRVSYGVF